MNNLKQDLSNLHNPSNLREDLCFLVGAGTSRNLPQTYGIIKAIIYTLSKPLGSKAAANMAKILVTQSLLGRDVDFAIKV